MMTECQIHGMVHIHPLVLFLLYSEKANVKTFELLGEASVEAGFIPAKDRFTNQMSTAPTKERMERRLIFQPGSKSGSSLDHFTLSFSMERLMASIERYL